LVRCLKILQKWFLAFMKPRDFHHKFLKSGRRPPIFGGFVERKFWCISIDFPFSLYHPNHYHPDEGDGKVFPPRLHARGIFPLSLTAYYSPPLLLFILGVSFNHLLCLYIIELGFRPGELFHLSTSMITSPSRLSMN